VRATPQVRFFGTTTGFVVNYTPDHTVRFDLSGNPVELLPRAYTPGVTTISIGARKMTADGFSKIIEAASRRGSSIQKT